MAWLSLAYLSLNGAAVAAPDLEQLKQASLEERKCLCKQLDSKELSKQVRPKARFVRVRETTSPVDAQSAAGELLARAEVALQASVEGAKAGFTIAPLQFDKDYAGPVNVQLTVAAFEDGRTRLGAALNLAYTAADPSPQDLGLSFCGYDEAAYRASLDKLGSSMNQTCELIAALPDPAPTFAPGEEPRERQTWRTSRFLCGVAEAPQVEPPTAPGACKVAWTFEDAAARIVRALDNETERLNALGAPAQSERTQYTEKLRAINIEQTALKDYKTPGFLSGIDDDALKVSIRRFAWKSTRWVVGVDGRIEAFPQTFGFNPDPDPEKNPLPQAQLSAWRIELAGSVGRERASLKLGLLFGQERTKHTDPLDLLSVGPSVKVSYVLGSLAGELTDPTGNLLLRKGELPPLLLLGFDSSVAFATVRPKTHPRPVDKANAAVWLEFRFTEKLAVRTGLQLDVKTVTRAGDTTKTPPITELRDLQYSIPVFVLTAMQF
ncbi:hypothetical protein [Archangium sp. Cb G35]|uniref:hypothetical protein n=1 Tax=Archangium sp. Cb G35 TaxID=1920190 RepID=UPI000AF9E4C5|nr:hypothetical protein [Archangium sp. Cb G35]